jgi:hypothetical protein
MDTFISIGFFLSAASSFLGLVCWILALLMAPKSNTRRSAMLNFSSVTFFCGLPFGLHLAMANDQVIHFLGLGYLISCFATFVVSVAQKLKESFASH